MEHVVNRDFEYIASNVRNRQAFLSSCQRAFSSFDEQDQITAADLYQLITLLCPTTPEGRVNDLPRLLKVEIASKLPFGDLANAWFVYFAYYDFLHEIKKLFQDGSRKNEQRTCTLDAILQTLPTSSSLDLNFSIPSHFIERAVGASKEISFDDLCEKLLRDRDLSKYTLGHSIEEWNPREVCEEIGDLFQKRNLRGEVGAEEDEQFSKTSKAKKDKTKPLRKNKSLP